MIRVNENYLKLQSSYLFSEIGKRMAEFQKKNPQAKIIRMGIGDVTLPLPRVCLDAFHKAVDEMGDAATFKGYGPDLGYDFLREAVAKHDFQAHGADINADEVIISDGAKCDSANIQELFASDITIAVPDPVYPVYVDSNVMAGRTGSYSNGRYGKLVYLESTEKNNFIPNLPEGKVDLIYLCFPNNPTGATITKDALKKWVDYARENKALIIYDAAYVQFIRDTSLPQSIFEIPGSREVAIEMRSYSKTAGFTGTRCAYTVIPRDCKIWTNKGEKTSLHGLWNRRQTTKFNGVSYPVQRAAAAIYTPEGQKEIREISDYYLGNAALIRKAFTALGYKCTGGENSPYIWLDTGMDSWEFFDKMLAEANVVITPGAGFGKCGEGFIRVSAFNQRENVEKALERIKAALVKK
ncbi:MAG: LL-diaminopimelate aminotransferase [Spirochaetaceae bacterium]|nr:MAG: LL-diaminopimelate aminotransferase [Spirochaetaceae bacterium]